MTDKMSYVSTAEGTLIEFLLGKQLSGIVALEKVPARTNLPIFCASLF
ncbi:MAG: hypothetical protein ACE5I5_19420 [Candidatus Heimdallarchaeota archaeon]